MTCSRRSWLLKLAALAVLAALPTSAALAQTDYPNRPLRLVVGFAPGGSNDIVARLLAEKFNKSLGQPAIVENKPGGGGAVAATFVKSQPADGYTLLVGASGAMVVGPPSVRRRHKKLLGISTRSAFWSRFRWCSS